MSKGFSDTSRGRPPWYSSEGAIKVPLVIGVSGASASGKTSLCRNIVQKLGLRWVVHLSMDAFYKPLSAADKERAHSGDYNFDHPDAFDYTRLKETLIQLKHGKSVEIPVYDFVTHSRLDRSKTLYGADVILAEGILLFFDKEVRSLCDMRLFVDEDSDITLIRRIRRDIAERGRDVGGILVQYERFVKPAYEQYIFPTKKFADIVIPRGGHNTVALKLITRHILNELQERGYVSTWSALTSLPPLKELPPNIHLMPSTPQTKIIHTVIRDQQTTRDDFCFYSKRLSRLVIEEAISYLEFTERIVTLHNGSTYVGLEMEKVFGVTIMRGGQVMEEALVDTLNVPTGKILIQNVNGEPRLFDTSLVSDMKGKVFLLDPIIGSGATVQMAIHVLLDQNIREQDIFLVSLIGSLPGLHYLTYFYPKINIFLSAIDPELNEQGDTLPGLGTFGDRYFGT